MHKRLLGALMLTLVLMLAACLQPLGPAAAPAASGNDVFTYWGGLIFSDDANQMLVDRITQWGNEKGIKTEVVMINQNETVQRVSAAIEAGTLPDALDVGRGFMFQLNNQGQLEPLDELYAEIAKINGGWLPASDQATNPELYGGHRYGIPFSLGGNVLFRRADILEAAGYADAPATWMDVAKMATAQRPPETYGMGFALSNVGDANLTTVMLQSWGGRIADDTGKTCTLNTPEVKEFVTWITDAFKAGLFPPGVTTWDGGGDNTAYLAGNAIFIANPGSVYLAMQKDDPDLGRETKYSALPAGPKMRISPVDANVRIIPKTSKHKELAIDLMKNLADPAFMKEYYSKAIYGPAAVGYEDAPIFLESPVHRGLLDLALNGTFGGFPDVDNAAFAEYQTNFLTPRIIQRVVVDNLSVDDAIAETQKACQDIYDKYK